jgi:hypothetical protein
MLASLWILGFGQALAWTPLVNDAGKEVYWGFSEVHYSINLGGVTGISEEDVENAITKSAEVWIGGNMRFVYDGETTASRPAEDDGFNVFFEDGWDQDPGVLALTYTWSSPETGEIEHFDIAINADHFDWTTAGEGGKYDLENAITHEFGHALGLDHSDDPDASMAPTAAPNEVVKRNPNDDDLTGYKAIYPGNPSGSDGAEEGDAPPTGSDAPTGGGELAQGSGSSSVGGGGGFANEESGGCSSAKATPSTLCMMLLVALLGRKREEA